MKNFLTLSKHWINIVLRHLPAAVIIPVSAIVIFGGGLSLLSRGFGGVDGSGAGSWLPWRRSLPSRQASAAPSPIPKLAREYIYVGRRMLAVEDEGSESPPPADLAVWRPKSGTWWVLGGGTGDLTQNWGAPGDIPLQGDFDGDGKTDLCVFRPAARQWWVLESSSGSYFAVTFGAPGDKPVRADFDGDGKTDIAVFRPSDGTWYVIESSSGAVAYTKFGIGTDVPTPADFDGDGRADIAVWRKSDATFYSLNTTNSLVKTVRLEVPGEPVPADYDGDGRTDQAIRRGDDWVILNSAGGNRETIRWQSSSDLAVQNDYDGDGRVDIAVWRPSNGTWYIRKSSTGDTRTEQWGMNGDIPVPALYRR